MLSRHEQLVFGNWRILLVVYDIKEMYNKYALQSIILLLQPSIPLGLASLAFLSTEILHSLLVNDELSWGYWFWCSWSSWYCWIWPQNCDSLNRYTPMTTDCWYAFWRCSLTVCDTNWCSWEERDSDLITAIRYVACRAVAIVCNETRTESVVHAHYLRHRIRSSTYSDSLELKTESTAST